jgi:uncharacterized protein (DUF302 family)
VNFIKNILALVGLAAIVVVVIGVMKIEPISQEFQPMINGYKGLSEEDQSRIHGLMSEFNKAIETSRFDSGAFEAYLSSMEKLFETGNGAEASVWKAKVEEGLSAEEVEETMRFVANEHNIKNVGELPLYQEVEKLSGESFRFLKIYMFCNAMTAAKMVNHSDSYSAFLPCRVALVEDKEGQLWIYSLNMDMMIHGGEPLPEDLYEEAVQVKTIIQDIMQRGAAGDF